MFWRGNCGFANWAPFTESEETLNKETGHSRWVGGRFNKPGNLLTRLVLGGRKTNRSSHLPARILKVYRKALTGFSHVHHPDGLNNT